MKTSQGFLLVIEGIDGSGKTTQIELLKQYLASQVFDPEGFDGELSRTAQTRRGEALQVEVISFPRYEDNLYGKLIKRYLEGEFGEISNVNPYLMALAFAGDRLLAKPLIESWLQSGKVVVANRYVSSSKAHLSANLPEEKREEFMSWIDQLEYQTNGMPKPDLTVLLNIDPKTGQKNARKESEIDIHEENLAHLEAAGKIYLELSKSEDGWVLIECMENLNMKSKEEIQKKILEILTNKAVFTI